MRKHREKAWTCADELTPHGKKLAMDAFQKVNVRDYNIEITTQGDTYCCVVNRLTSSNKYTTLIPGNDTNGSFFGTCNCGVPRVDGLPCQHMIAVCKSGCIKGLDESNVMPYWWHTSHWRKQYPQVGGPHEKMSFFQIASPILSIPIHSKVCQYGPCKFSLKKNDPFLTYEHPKVSVFLSLVTGLVTD